MTDDQSTSQEVTATEPTTPQESEVIHKPAPVVEFEPPLACVRRILKNSLPATANVGKDAAAAFSRAAGIFIIYVTACANDFAREHKRQTITAADVLAAIKELDFDEFTPEMTEFLESYRAMEKEKKEAKAKKKGNQMEEASNADSKKEAGSENAQEDDDEEDEEEELSKRERDDDEEDEDMGTPNSKKLKGTADEEQNSQPEAEE